MFSILESCSFFLLIGFKRLFFFNFSFLKKSYISYLFYSLKSIFVPIWIKTCLSFLLKCSVDNENLEIEPVVELLGMEETLKTI